MSPPAHASDLADALVAFVAEQVEDLASHYAPGLVLPRAFAGHAVGPDTRADLAYTLGLLLEAGTTKLAGCDVAEAVLAILRGLDGARTDTFYSYRAAESLLRVGGYHDNPRLGAWSDAERANLRLAVDSSASAAPLRAGKLPVNYAIVVARCEHDRDALGLLDDPSLLDELCKRSRELLSRAADGWIDDSHELRGQYDIYTPDMFLFAEPLAERLGDTWSHGFRRVMYDVDALALPGGAIVWGRSIGALSIAMTIELAAVGAGRGLVEDPGPWLARAAAALGELRTWWSRGVIRAHQHRSTMFYRGPSRRLQMTLDVLGKLVQAALELRRAGHLSIAPRSRAFEPCDRLVELGHPPHGGLAAAWSHRERKLSFVLPLVNGFSSDYLPSPRSPGLLEQPTGGPPSLVPIVHREGKALVPGRVPIAAHLENGALHTTHEGFDETYAGTDPEPALVARRDARYRVEGRSLVVDEHLTIDADPASLDAVSLLAPMRADRPIDVRFESEQAHRVDDIDVDGLKEWQSFHGAASRVRQLDLEPARELHFRWTLTPQLRVASTAYGHPYDDALYGPLRERVRASLARVEWLDDPQRLADVDVLHMYWPEWWVGVDPDKASRALAALREAGVHIVWTQHNLVPHRFRGSAADACYALWAEAADGVIHHTEWGRQLALATRAYRNDAIHRVIPHGHWGARYAPVAAVPREKVAADLGLAPCAIRLGIVGAPRAEKDVQLVLDAFHACSRDDLQLVVFSLADERVPDDPRILALPNKHEPELVYYLRLTMLDALVLPFAREGGMLMTGTALDAIGAGKAALVSDWPLLGEVLGDGAIPYGQTREDLTRCLESLTPERVAASGDAIGALKAQTQWSDIAAATLALFEEVAAR